MKRRYQNSSGFTLVEIMIVVALVGLLATIAVPNFLKARLTAQKNTCINNLRVIDGLKQQWALENRRAATDTPTHSELNPYLVREGGTPPVCPSGGTANFASSYEIGDLQTPPTCQFVPTEHVLP